MLLSPKKCNLEIILLHHTLSAISQIVEHTFVLEIVIFLHDISHSNKIAVACVIYF
jgi:hypothetical protein